MEQSRYNGLDVLKCICAFLIVIIHTPFDSVFSDYLVALARVAVPIFLMITGFFYKHIVSLGKEKKQIKKIFWMMLVSNLIYLVWNVVLTLIKNKSVLEYFQETFSLKSILKFLLLNDSPFSGRLWYFGAILYTLIIVYFFIRFKKMKILYCMTPVLLLGDLILGKYSLLLLGREFPYIFVRNFLFVGIPYFCIGILISVYLPKIKTVLKRGTIFLVTAFFIA